MHPRIQSCREAIREHYLADEAGVISDLIANARLTAADREVISRNAADLVRKVRTGSSPSMMEKFLAEYGLTTKEGVALMCLAEALLRVPDTVTIDALIEDKVATGNWREHLGHSNSSLVNTSTWALLVTGKLLAPSESRSLGQTVKGMVKRLGEPLVRTAVAQAMKELGRQFVLGRDIQEATRRATKLEAQGYSYSYDMLGEAARTDADALRYHRAYSDAISALAQACVHDDIRMNPGISVKLSALHPRYEFAKRERVMEELVERTLSLAVQAKEANMGFNIDAEEADRLDLSLDVIYAVLARPELKGWSGFGVVVQAFGQRASFVLDWLYNCAEELDRKIMVRLVKGAYWDAEIKRAQVLGLDGFPVFTRKLNSDVSYMCCAEKLLGMTDRIYPQFATHNAHSVAAILHLARNVPNDQFEFQRLHGMGESLHDAVLKNQQTRCRIYAPVGAHQDLLAYLVRRLLENGANSSFVNQIVDTRIQPEDIAADPFTAVAALEGKIASQTIPKPADIYGAARKNALGWDITDPLVIAELDEQRAVYKAHQWSAGPMIAGAEPAGNAAAVMNPALDADQVGRVISATSEDVQQAIAAAREGFSEWSALSAQERAAVLNNIADVYEANAAEFFALVCREAGKTMLDAVGEVREAVDFARFYANEAIRIGDQQPGRGVLTCISPWNFPLAIFSGQVLACLAAGNAVLAKPADQTPLIAARAVELMHQAGVPAAALQLLPGSGLEVGVPLTSDSRIDGVCFTGSTATAQSINRVMAKTMAPEAPLVAETGGLNAMIVDSTALPEQVVRDVLISSFQSAGQRCSALRVLYLQEDIAEGLLEMLYGAMDELTLADPWALSSDIGPVIDLAAKQKIDAHCQAFAEQGRMLKRLSVPAEGRFVAPAVIRLDSIAELKEEIFGPVLHVVTFNAEQLDAVVDEINAQGYGLTFGLHTRVNNRVEQVVSRIQAGNMYVNRNQIGAVVGSQPFGGEGMSGTGPKAGGPQYVQRFKQVVPYTGVAEQFAEAVSAQMLQALIADVKQLPVAAPSAVQLAALADACQLPLPELDTEHCMPGPTGELNLLTNHARGVVLCLGPDLASLREQLLMALSQGNAAIAVAPGAAQLADSLPEGFAVKGVSGSLDEVALVGCEGFAAVASQAEPAKLQAYRQALAERGGALLPLLTEPGTVERYVIERHLCVDTTAAGGNASLIAQVE
ncbi:bifunctional proline dehydrogenase/L-glutamate gamma-semialdehyde dehydrogenase PutA [Aliamphritea hakodatensis]|uniref:bifunctional proline dehydrogenase/L-glutamate gamma-semialdehyde dehydrogenase PutA n=1 Tax=Aliamphritea hakodatensis TaxID=2895352 RepID=UPI0022FD8B3B|nr:bifunctional proline dehydrogenase/L-glutamate gamma-semialdehyde dehydrogenase PutA [Aliamphritea hakodatensis]